MREYLVVGKMCYIIKKMAKIHCARGPKGCKICREYAKEKKFTLLDIAPTNHLEAAKPMIELEIEGEKFFQVYDVMAYFDSLEEAENYAENNGLTIDARLID